MKYFCLEKIYSIVSGVQLFDEYAFVCLSFSLFWKNCPNYRIMELLSWKDHSLACPLSCPLGKNIGRFLKLNFTKQPIFYLNEKVFWQVSSSSSSSLYVQ